MSAQELTFLLLFCLVVLPVSAYMVVKFGAAGYFRARDKNNQKHKKKEG